MTSAPIGGSSGRSHTAAKRRSSSRKPSSSCSSEIATFALKLCESKPMRRPLTLRQGASFHSALPQRLPHGFGNCRRADAVAVDADGVELAGHRQSQRLLRGLRGYKHSARLVARCKTSIVQQLPRGEALAVSGYAGSPGRGQKLGARLATDARPMGAGHTHDRVGGCNVQLAAAVKGTVRLDKGDRRDRRKASDLEGDQRLDIVSRDWMLDTSKVAAVVITGVCPDLDPELPTPQRGGDRDRGRNRVHATPAAGAVDARENLLVCARALAQVRVQIHLCAVSPCKSWTAWASSGIAASNDSVAPLTLPGTLMMSVCPRTPAIERESAARGVLAAPTRLITSPIPGTSKSTSAAVAWGVTSRGPRPVPPVVTTKSTSREAAAMSTAVIRSRLSGTTSGPETLKPACFRAATSAGPLPSPIMPAEPRS